MERGSDKNSPMRDDAREKDLQGRLGQGGGHREEWLDPEAGEPDETDTDADVTTPES